MPQISQEKIKKIKEQILAFLYEQSPKSHFTCFIASHIIRDEEFTKRLLYELKKEGLAVRINKNPKGIKYLRRERWKLSSRIYEAYKKLQK